MGSVFYKAQVSVITIIVIAGIGTALAATAYMWGMPLIEKRATVTDYSASVEFLDRLESKIVSVANSLYGEESIDIPNGLITVVPYDAGTEENPNPDNNSIILEFNEPQPMMLNGEIYLDTEFLGDVAAYGQAEPRVITLSVERLETRINKFTFRMRFRELDTETVPKKGYQIMLTTPTGLIMTGINKLSISFDSRTPNPEVLPHEAANGGDLVATYLKVHPQ